MVSGLRGKCNLARETDAYTVSTREGWKRGGGERTYKEPTIDANESPEAQTSGTNLASQLQAEMGGQSLPALLSMGEGASLS